MSNLSGHLTCQEELKYLGHIVSRTGVVIDPGKIKAMVTWPTPWTVRALCGFLGLTGCYRRFIKDYTKIVFPLTDLLMKGFSWNDQADKAFQALKRAMTAALVLTLPNFNMSFELECDASGIGLWTVLMQGDCPIVFISKVLSSRPRGFSTYEKEMLAIEVVVRKWRPYLIGHGSLLKLIILS